MKFTRTAAVAALICSALALVGCTQSSAYEVPEKVLTSVETTKLSPETIKKEMVYAGQIQPSDSVSVVSKITGKVAEYYYDIGDNVKNGDTLFKLDEKDIQDQITQVNAQLNQSSQGVRSAQNSLSSVTGGKYQSEILQLESSLGAYDNQIAAAEITISNAKVVMENTLKTLENTQKGFDNTKALYEIDAVSKNDYDKAELGLVQAQAGFDQAKNAYDQAIINKSQLESNKNTAAQGLDIAKGQITQDNTRQAQIAVDSAMATRNTLNIQLELAMQTLNDTSVTAPMDGIISVRNAKKEEYTSSQLPAYVIINIDRVNVYVKVSELLINSINVGDEVDVVINSLDNSRLKGTIKTIAPSADQTGTFPVQIELNNPDHIIKPGMFAEVHFIREISTNTLVLPRNTILSDESNSYVFVNNNGTAKKVIIEPGIDNGQYIEVKSGLNRGDEIVTKGQSFIVDNEEINIVAVWGE